MLTKELKDVVRAFTANMRAPDALALYVRNCIAVIIRTNISIDSRPEELLTFYTIIPDGIYNVRELVLRDRLVELKVPWLSSVRVIPDTGERKDGSYLGKMSLNINFDGVRYMQRFSVLYGNMYVTDGIRMAYCPFTNKDESFSWEATGIEKYVKHLWISTDHIRYKGDGWDMLLCKDVPHKINFERVIPGKREEIAVSFPAIRTLESLKKELFDEGKVRMYVAKNGDYAVGLGIDYLIALRRQGITKLYADKNDNLKPLQGSNDDYRVLLMPMRIGG